MHRLSQFQLILSTLVFSWLAMQVVHESGHVLHAWTSGGTVTAVSLHPLEISRTDFSPNPHPQFVAWGGPLWGSLIPLAIYGLVRWRKWSRSWLAAFFAGFCLTANGAYLLGGSLFPAGDAAELLRHGAPRATLIIFGIAALASGLSLWNGLGRHFGLGTRPESTDRRAAWAMSAATVALIVTELCNTRS
ncbi:MAG: M50 family metallopeptidase [Deltaproteobacteria bacterium]